MIKHKKKRIPVPMDGPVVGTVLKQRIAMLMVEA